MNGCDINKSSKVARQHGQTTADQQLRNKAIQLDDLPSRQDFELLSLNSLALIQAVIMTAATQKDLEVLYASNNLALLTLP